MLSENKKSEDLVLETLSFFEPMTEEKIILDFDGEKLKLLASFTKEDLKLVLEKLEKEKKVKVNRQTKEWTYIKLRPVRGLKKILRFLNLV